MKNIAIYTGGFIGSMLVVSIAIYLLYPVMEPEIAEEVHKKLEQKKSESAEEISFEDEMNTDIDSTSSLIPTREDSLLIRIDSLTRELEKAKAEFEQQLKAKDEEKVNEQTVQAAKTLLNMDEEALSPIVSQLNDDQLLKIYSVGSNTQREKLLRSLSPEKASKILKKVIL